MSGGACSWLLLDGCVPHYGVSLWHLLYSHVGWFGMMLATRVGVKLAELPKMAAVQYCSLSSFNSFTLKEFRMLGLWCRAVLSIVRTVLRSHSSNALTVPSSHTAQLQLASLFGGTALARCAVLISATHPCGRGCPTTSQLFSQVSFCKASVFLPEASVLLSDRKKILNRSQIIIHLHS